MMNALSFILLGPPGVQLPDHAMTLAGQRQVSHVSFSNLVEQAIAQGSDIGKAIQSLVATGETVPDEPGFKLVRRRLEQPDTVLKGWVLEDFPQTVAQAQALDHWWGQLGHPLPTVIYLKAMSGILMNRLASEPGQTASAPALRRQLDQYHADVEPVLAYYQQRDRLQTVNASLPFGEVSRSVMRLCQPPQAAAPLIQDEAELDELIYSRSRLVVDCMASWCGSCKQVTPSIDKLAEEYRDRVSVMKIDFDANRQISKRFGLKGIPAVMFFKDGQLQTILTGVKSYPEYTEALSSLLNETAP